MIIRGATVVDGTGGPPRVQDVAIVAGRIVEVGAALEGEAREVFQAQGLIVTPGFIDVHTHYDAQLAWDAELLPSSAHGVTTVVVGNCGVGLAPVRATDRDRLMHLLEVIEEVPVAVMSECLAWTWESFADYLSAMGCNEYAIDVAALLPHVALREYVMGARGRGKSPANAEDIAAMRAIVFEAVRAGALGVSTSRSCIHMTESGPLPGTYAANEELLAIAEAIRDAGGGVFQMIPSGQSGVIEGDGGENVIAGMRPDPYRLSQEVETMRWLHRQTGVTCTFSFAMNSEIGPDYARATQALADAHAAGEQLYPQYSPRPLNALSCLDAQHIFTSRPTYRAIAHLPRAERAARMAEPAIRAAILSESDLPLETSDPLQMMALTFRNNLKYVHALPDYEPLPATSVRQIARDTGRNPEEVYYDLLIADEGRAVLAWFADYRRGDMTEKEQTLQNPNYLVGLGDGGAHYKLIVDASHPTFLLAHWGRDRTRGRRFPIEMLVHRLTKLPADVAGFADRGVVAPGMRADLNVIDFDRLGVSLPRIVADLPAGAQRFLQDATGYVLTMVNGVPTRRNDRDTGARPGRITRNPRASSVPGSRVG